jgi:hypothetical protein
MPSETKPLKLIPEIFVGKKDFILTSNRVFLTYAWKHEP